MIAARPALVSVFCADHVALADWYRTTFGFAELEALASPIFMALDTGSIGMGFHHDDAYDLLGLAAERARRGTAIHLTLDVGTAAEVDAALPVLVERGASILKAPFTTYYGARQIVFADPEGNPMRLSSSQSELQA
ncbi:hypothetical protein BH10ACT1_BH10ACT1_07030 [soil metagenome]